MFETRNVTMASSSTTEAPIYLTFLNGTGYCFNVDDYMKIRTEFRIVGSFMGACNMRGWTPGENGLPAEFNCYETQLLVEKGLAQLISKRSLLGPPSGKQQNEYKDFLDQRISEQEALLKAGKLQESERNIEKILAGKRKKLRLSRVAEEDIKLNPESVLKEISDAIAFDRQNALLDIPQEHPFEHDATIIQLPPDTSLKYLVFKDIWERGKYITSGEAFGGDFLIYPGDPMMFHASHVVIVKDQPTVAASELVMKARLAVAVRKICVFAYISNKDDSCSASSSRKDEITYQSIQWKNLNAWHATEKKDVLK